MEDNSTNQMVAQGILRNLGYSAEVAADGVEALEALARNDYSAVLMDCQMPRMDGFTATGEIRRRQGDSRHIPIIAMTAGAIEGDRERCLAAGMDDYISKPVKPEDVDAALARWIGEIPAGEGGLNAARSGLGSSATTDEVVDHRRLEMLRGMGPDSSFLGTMVEAFLSEAPANMAALIEAVKGSDAPTLRQSAHRLRGAASNVGTTGLAAICSQLEQLGSTGQLEEAPELLDGLRTELDRAATALRAAVASGI